MKLWFVCLLLSVAAARADNGLRQFTAHDGRTLQAKVVSYDPASDKVTIERADRKRITVAGTAFSEIDQRYLKAWYVGEQFLSSKFNIDIEREEVETSKKEHDVDMSTAFSSGRGSGRGIVTVATDKRTQYRFNLLLENNSKTAFKNIDVEYRVFYEQEKAIPDEKANKNRDEEDERPEIHMAVPDERVKDGQTRIRTLDLGESKKMATKNITILKRSANRPWGDKIDLKGDLHGIWLKLTIKGPDGPVVRDVAYPPGILKKFTWNPPEAEPQTE